MAGRAFSLPSERAASARTFSLRSCSAAIRGPVVSESVDAPRVRMAQYRWLSVLELFKEIISNRNHGPRCYGACFLSRS